MNNSENKENTEPKPEKEGFNRKLSRLLAYYFKEDDLENLSWLVPDGDVDRFVLRRINKFIIAALIMSLISVALIAMNYFLHIWFDLPVFVYIIAAAVVSYLAFKSDYLKIKNTFKKKKKDVYNSFPLWVSTLQILIMTNNITNTFKKSIPTCPDCFRHDLEVFVSKIEFDPENKEYYKSFLKKYGIEEIQEIIMDMYAFNKMDKKEIIHQFTTVNERLNKIQANIRTRRQEQNLFFISALNSIPILIGSLYVLITSMMISGG